MDIPQHTFKGGASFYTERPEDPKAIYLTKDNFPVKGDGVSDDSDALQQAINRAKGQCGYGIVFIPEGTYRISKTIYIPKAIRVIGYGKNRPLIVLGKDSPEFQEANPRDKGHAKYMIWFVDRVPLSEEDVRDANPGTFYSALSNINLTIEDGNPAAVALRTHFAQHSFIAHVDIHIDSGKAGVFDVGNEMEDVRFFGGEYGIYTTKPSPGWPFMMVDTYFEGQRKAAIKTREAGLTIVRMNVKNTPIVIETDPDYIEKLYMEDCQFENITDTAVIISNENNSHNQINLRNVACKDVPVLASYRQSGNQVKIHGGVYKVNSFTHGNQIENLGCKPKVKTTHDIKVLGSLPSPAVKDIPDLPDMKTWVNLKSLGAKGDGVTDDTEVIIEAIEKFTTIYIPQGRYRVSETITLKSNTILIGLNPIATQLVLADNTESFGGLGSPKALLEVPKGGTNIVFGIGIDAGTRNPRAVGCKWMAGEHSYMNDVKFIGGHGSMSPEGGYVPVYNQNRTGDANPDLKWDAQYWSLWITNGGGGIFKDIWSASTYSEAGLYVSDTSTTGKIYAMSVEHHVRHEVKFKNVSNWKVLALQLEEEVAESWHCQPLEISDCCNITFANLYFFRVIWIINPYPYAIRTWNVRGMEFLNVHNYTQIKHTIDNTLLDVTTNTEVRPWEIARLYISGTKTLQVTESHDGKIQKIADGFEFADAVCKDSKGNMYFCDSRWKRIYKWSVESDSLSLVTDIHYKPMSLACDKDDNLLVVVEYFPPKGATINGQPEVYTKPNDAGGTSYGDWYNVGSTIKVYAINPDHPEDNIQILKTVPMGTVKNVYKALYPANRWRDSSDYLQVTVKKPEECYVAPDGVTIIPVTYDLMRAAALLEAYPDKPFYAADEYLKRTVLFDISAEGYASNPRIFAEKGEYNIATDAAGNVYIPDGEIYIFNNEGVLTGEITVPERPACIVFGDKDGKTLYITARTSLYRVRNS